MSEVEVYTYDAVWAKKMIEFSEVPDPDPSKCTRTVVNGSEYTKKSGKRCKKDDHT